MEDFNLPSPARVALLERLQAAIGGGPPHFWAACQICDLNALEKLVKCGHEYPEILRAYAHHTMTMVYHWSSYPSRAQSKRSTPRSTPKALTPQKSGFPDSDLIPEGSTSLNPDLTPQNWTPSMSPLVPPSKKQKTSASPILSRSQRAKDLAKERDGSCCVLTGITSIQIAHIYPHHSIKYKENNIFGQRHIFWDQLKTFWPKEKVAAWEAELFPAGMDEHGIETVSNLLTLSRDAHCWWGVGAFALKPISQSDNNKTLEVQLFWQQKQENLLGTMSLLTKPVSTEGLDRNIGAFEVGVTRLMNINDQRIRSGDYFKLQTDNPETKPLPSFQLLELQWFLQRIQGMAGAADVDQSGFSDSTSDYSDMEEVSDLMLDEFIEPSFISSDPASSPTKVVPNHFHYPIHPKHRTEEVAEDHISQQR